MSRMRRDGTKGQALVEFALILPIFILVLAGIFDGARAIYAYNTISNAARAGAREAVVNQTPSDIRGVAKQAGVALGMSDANVQLAPCSVKDCEYGVTVTYQFVPVVPGLNAIFRPSMSSTVAMPVEFKNP